MKTLKAPWYYLTWQPPILAPELEMALARYIRRVGMLRTTLIFLGVFSQEGVFTAGCATLAIGQNYPVFIGTVSILNGDQWPLYACAAWALTVLVATARHTAWMLALLSRWPPMAAG